MDITLPLTKLHGYVVGTLASYLWLCVLYRKQSEVASIQHTKACGGVEAQLHSFLASTLDGAEWSALRTGNHWLGGWVHSKDPLDILRKREVAGLI
jgi:hypothetical protein